MYICEFMYGYVLLCAIGGGKGIRWRREREREEREAVCIKVTIIASQEDCLYFVRSSEV